VEIIREIKNLNEAKNHKSSYPNTIAHQQFLIRNLEKTKALEIKYPFLDLKEEINHFSKQIYNQAFL
jgi:hypothetical protein